MDTVTTITAIERWLTEKSVSGKKIGFVPTMGALHQGHISLISASASDNDYTICSIFVNPIQFNNAKDLEKYPRMPDEDMELLSANGCDLLFMPDINEMYPEPVDKEYEFGDLGKVMEGAHRPGHFNGVAIVVNRLFEIVKPHRAYFGLKDYQQLLIIREMAAQEGHNIEIIGCPIVRESDGLAMSSRNMRLTVEQRKNAPQIYKSLEYAAENYQGHSVISLKKSVEEMLGSIPGTSLEYIEFADAETLMPITTWSDASHCVVCVAIYFGEIRLIDNIRVY